MYNLKTFLCAWFLIVFTGCGVSVFAQYQNRRPTVRLPQGILIGTKVYSDSGAVADAYFGIPYAAPPVGNLRFSPPQRHHGWNGTLHALNQAPSCPQLPILNAQGVNDEDCLYLNVWAPENTGRNTLVPVMIIFEGVEFGKMNVIRIPGQDLTMENILTVTVNYRTNVFGFLSIGTPELRGNYGLIDQYFAMIWVRENAKYFGGDPDRITLFGHSAGAASVAYHMTSPRTSGLFHRVIMASGSLLSPWHLPSNSFQPSEKIISLLGCSNNYAHTMMQCLRSKRTVEILKAYEEYIEVGNGRDGFNPVIDTFLPESDRYLPNEPLIAFQEGTMLQLPILTGVARIILDPQSAQWNQIAQQGAVNLQQFFEQSKINEIMRKYQLDQHNKEEIIELIKWRYIYDSQRNTRLLLEQLKSFEYDTKIETPHYLQINHLLRTYQQPIYVYDINDFGIQINNTNTDSLITSDLILLFGPFLLNQLARRRFSGNELRQSKRLKQLIANFVMFGNPTPSNNVKSWKKYTAPDYYIEQIEAQTLDDSLKRAKRVSFWTQLLPKLSNPNFHSEDNVKELYLSPDPAAGFRHAMYTLVGLVIALLGLLTICIVLLKRRAKETERHLHMGF